MTPKKRTPSVADQILEALEERGYRATEPRRALAALIGSQERHFTAETLRRELPLKHGRATIYRTLKLLVEAGVLCRVLLEDGDLHYQLSQSGHHHHLLCVHCGASQDLTGCNIEEMLQGASSSYDFQISSHWLEIYGRCRNCQQQESLAA